jgi:hypothetical protein
MRPIVSDTNSTTNNLAKHLLPYLQSVERQFITAVPSSLAVVDNIIRLNSNQLITRNTQLVTMDIEALFTRIPQDRLLDIVNHQITEQLSDAELKDKFMYYLRTIINNNTFQVNDSYCLQKIGLPMGGPLSGTLANIYLGFMETRVMNFPKVLLYNRFMDDILVVCNFSDKEMNQFIQTLHSTINLKIIASFNKESVNFLDLSIFLSLRKRLLFIQPFSKRPHCFPVPSILGSRGAKSDVNIIKSQVLRVYRQTTDSRSFSLAVNKYLGFILSKAHRHIRKAIFQFLLPLKISTHKWTVEIPLCGECKGISNLNGISVVKILKIDANYVAIKEPLNCKSKDIHFIIKSESGFNLHYVTSLHVLFHSGRVMKNIEILPIGQLQDFKLKRFLSKHPSVNYFNKENAVKLKTTLPCHLFNIYKRPTRVYGVPCATKAVKTFASMFNQFKKISRI